MGWRKRITLLEGSHVFYARLADKSSLKMKTPEWRWVVFWNTRHGIFTYWFWYFQLAVMVCTWRSQKKELPYLKI